MFDPLSEYALYKVPVSEDTGRTRIVREEMSMSKTTEFGSQGVENQGERQFGLEPRLLVRADLKVADSGHRPSGILETGTCPSQARLPKIATP